MVLLEPFKVLFSPLLEPELFQIVFGIGRRSLSCCLTNKKARVHRVLYTGLKSKRLPRSDSPKELVFETGVSYFRLQISL